MKFKKVIMISILDTLNIVHCFKIKKIKSFLKKVIRISVLNSSNIV
jgi:hypothetical protein